MKVLLDTNLYISYLLSNRGRRTISDIIRACLGRADIELLVPQEVIAELTRSVQGKPYLRARISQQDLDDLLETLGQNAIIPPSLETILPLSRDPDDDYLLAYGLMESADYLVTGDDDLLALGSVESLTIISAPRFWKLLGLG